MLFPNSLDIYGGKIAVYLLSGSFSLGILQQDAEINFAGDNSSSFHLSHQTTGRRPNSSEERESAEDREETEDYYSTWGQNMETGSLCGACHVIVQTGWVWVILNWHGLPLQHCDVLLT